MLSDSVSFINDDARITGLAKEKTIHQLGELVQIVGVSRWFTPNQIRLTSLKALVTTAPTGSSLTGVIKNNGVAISAPFVIAAGTTSVVIDDSAMIKTVFEANSYFTLDILSVGSIIKGSNLAVQLNYVETGAV